MADLGRGRLKGLLNLNTVRTPPEADSGQECRRKGRRGITPAAPGYGRRCKEDLRDLDAAKSRHFHSPSGTNGAGSMGNRFRAANLYQQSLLSRAMIAWGIVWSLVL